MNIWVVNHTYGDGEDGTQLGVFRSKKGADCFARVILKDYEREYKRKIEDGDKLMDVTQGVCDVVITRLKVQA